MLAERAWKEQGCPYWEPDQDPAIRLPRTKALELWRQMEQERRTGRKHLTQCVQADYLLLYAHFARLAGDTHVAEVAEERTAGDDIRRARSVLYQAMARAKEWIERPREYAESIARSKYRRTIVQLDAKELWTLTFDLRRAANARKKKGASK